MGRVTDRPGQHAVYGRAEVRVAEVGPERRVSAGGLDADDATERRRVAYRAGAVGAVRHRGQPRRERGRRPAARSARSALPVPRVAADPVELRRRHRRAELGHVGLAEDDEAGVAEAMDDRIIGRGDVVDERLARVRGRQPGDVGDVLHRDRDAEEGWELVRLDAPDQLVRGAGRVERAVTVDGDEGAEIGVELVDPAR